MTVQAAKVVMHYSALPRESKQQLEQVLQEWMSWHRALFPPAVALPATMQLFDGVLEFAPALLPDTDSPVAFVDIPRPGKRALPQKERCTSHYEESGDVPRYDCTVALPLDPKGAQSRVLGSIGSASGAIIGSLSLPAGSQTRQRCWNCGSYSHSLRDCWQPRDEEAIVEARQAMPDSGRKPKSGPKRYFSEAADEEAFPDLAPGRLSPELREALGIAAGAPPPWLHRMQALGYPPGYRGRVQEEGVAADLSIMDGDGRPAQAAPAGDDADEAGDVNIMDDDVDAAQPALERLGSAGAELVAFPGVNAPLPVDADPLAWGWPMQAAANQHGMAMQPPTAHANHVAEGWPQQQPWQHRGAHGGAPAGWGAPAVHAVQPAHAWAAPLPVTPPHLWPAAPAQPHASPIPYSGLAPRMQQQPAAGPGCWPAQAPQAVQPQPGHYPVQLHFHLQQPPPNPYESNLQHLQQPAPGIGPALTQQAPQQQPMHAMQQGQPQLMPGPDMGLLWAAAVRSASANVQAPPPPPLPPEP